MGNNVELILGTVQLGLDYGINNKSGKPSLDNSFKILDYAYNNGISLLDTASAYGESESIIGKYISDTGNEFQIATKLSSLDDSDDISEFIDNQLSSSLLALSKNYIDFYLIHNFNDLIENKELLNILKDFKDSKKICNIGVSLYDPSELEYLLLNHSEDIDFVQIPFNILDSRWVKDDLFNKTKAQDIKIFVRSIFLQGLIFLDNKEEMDKIDSSLCTYLEYINELASEKDILISRLAMDYIKSFNEIDGILVGCETVDQLEENINQFNIENSIDEIDKQNIINMTNNISEKIIDPRKW